MMEMRISDRRATPANGSNREYELALIGATQHSLVKPIFAGMLGAITLTLLVGLAAISLMAQPVPSWPTVIGAALTAGIASAWLVAKRLAKAIATATSSPAQMLIEQLDSTDLEQFQFRRGKALTSDEIDADIRLLQRRMREVSRRSRVMFEELNSARERACQENLAKSQFLANMSHELRTPLNAILGYAMLLHEDASEAGNASVVADLGRIQTAGRNLLKLINDILDLSKLETGGATLDRVAIDVKAIAGSAVNASGATSRPNGNSFRMSIDDRIGIMVGDPRKVRQCLENLLSNAFKFTRDGTVELVIEPIERDGKSWISFQVCDTGIGINKENVERLFDAFKQADGSSSRPFGGTGLGLALVQKYVGMMGGSCLVDSEPDNGSKFTLLLPVGDSPRAEDSFGSTAAIVRPNWLKTSESAHVVLVIDDDEAAIDLMERWLVRMGFSVVSSTSGITALDLARIHKPDFILLDALLPTRSGYDVLKSLRADPQIGHIPTIIVTVDDDRARGLRAGATDYLRKPISEHQLRKVLDVYRLQASGDILVIDDDDDSADLLARSVAQVGFSARRAVNGLQGLEMAAFSRPDAIVLDLAMPEMDGFEFLTRLAANASLRDVPLIVVSGCDIAVDEHRKLAAAGHRFFPKGASTPREIAQSLKELVA